MPRTSQLREKILTTSVGILASDGLEGLHARSVAAALEINHASVHYYFKSRADLLAAVAQFAVAGWSSSLERVKESKDGESLKTHMDAFHQTLDRTNARVFVALLAACPTNPAVAEHLRAFAASQSEELGKSIERTRGADVKVRKGPLRQGSYLLAALMGAEILLTTETEIQDWPAGFSDALID